MTIRYINTGTSANKGDGDSLRTAFNTINQNFSYISTSVTFITFGDGSEPLRRVNTIPGSSTSTGVSNQVAFTGTNMYVCINTNTWVRFSGTTF